MAKQYFVSGIGTEVGKTVASAILTQALKAEYWKPVQSGDLHYSDSHKIQEWVSHSNLVIHPERYRLNTPASPHLSARLDGVEIQLNQFKIPNTEAPLIVEGAGGLLVPLSEQDLLIDLMQQLNLPVILVVRNYLGSINHTLMSIEMLKQRNIPLAGLVYSGSPNEESQTIIEQFSGVKTITHLPELEEVNANSVAGAAGALNLDL